MPEVGGNCHELRVTDGNVNWRIVYGVANDAVVILDVLEKKTRTTPETCDRRGEATLEELSARCGGGVMRTAKRKKLEDAGWRVADAREFLKLSEAEMQFVEVKLALARLLRKLRASRRLTQMELAERLGSSQSRVAKLEAGDPSVSVDLLVRSALAAGATKKDLADALSSRRR
jgi:DNA-binding XRE family transcriptional regulator